MDTSVTTGEFPGRSCSGVSSPMILLTPARDTDKGGQRRLTSNLSGQPAEEQGGLKQDPDPT
ncbi:hypothetical protein ACSHXN_00390 [Streptomyces sp. HUAS TT11]|uniref:hypothetical protein n=1 Tax=Streptomyces sp. HUAS TT11 TaxID=3447508 RepID=UPI003F65520A